ncbi:MAG: DNA invertase Pin-like site-specific DNA recombinase [Cocleimonas sp.]|jgi:DNA invertase Pin-like site-specific DNA recombinase
MKIGYSRVSTNDQNQQLQIDALTNVHCERIYQENLSGNSKNRPVLSQMLDALREGDTVVVWKLDRLGRSMKDLIELVEGFKKLNIQFISLSENIDSSSPSGELIFHVFASLAQFERSLIIERTNAGLTAARARGRVGGRKPKFSDGDIAKAQAMAKSNDISISDIAKHFGVSRTTLYKYLK